MADDRNPASPPSKVARLSSDEAGVVTMAAPSPLMLGLGLGLGVGVESGKSVFTFMQLQELEHQALIYKYMVAGIPVPLHLIVPIWKSVAASYGPHHYPSFMGLASLCYDYRNSMEPEPGRCRRTDGKKWRCSRDVVPDQKYCERHMHRGRNRSRKPVEAGAGGGGTAAPVSIAPAQAQASSTNLSIAIPSGGLQLMPAGNGTGANSSSSRIGFSPTSVLRNSTTCKTGAS